MAVGQKYNLAIVPATTTNGGIGALLNVLDLDGMTIQLAAIGGATGTVQFEGSIDDQNWFSLGAAMAAAGAFDVPFKKLSSVRARTTVSIAGGSYVATLGGFMGGE